MGGFFVEAVAFIHWVVQGYPPVILPRPLARAAKGKEGDLPSLNLLFDLRVNNNGVHRFRQPEEELPLRFLLIDHQAAEIGID
ncbi:MAG: hypothetical protein ACRD96_24745 [Bryobacteraceae bacterium]